jgi:hypothetical protein
MYAGTRRSLGRFWKGMVGAEPAPGGLFYSMKTRVRHAPGGGTGCMGRVT